MKCSEVKKFRAHLTRHLLNSNKNFNLAFSPPGHLYDQSNFPQLASAQRTTVTNAPIIQSAEITNKLDIRNEVILKLNDRIEKFPLEFEEMRKLNEALKWQVLVLYMENQTIRSRINEREELIKDVLLPFRRD